MKNSKNKRSIILGIILLGLLVLAYKMMFMAPTDDTLSAGENIAASVRVGSILQQVENIKFDTSITEDRKFKSLKSIEIPLISLPIGKKDPFSGI
jgi:hypothetical protein